MTTLSVHRTEDPRPINTYMSSVAQHAAWRRRVTSWTSEQGVADRLRFRSDGVVLGVVHTQGAPVPDGWRVLPRETTEDATLIVPYLRSIKGRQLANALGSLRRPADVRGKLPGLPESCLIDGRRATYRLELREPERGGVLYAVWDAEVPSSVIKVPGMWRPVSADSYTRLVHAERHTATRRPAPPQQRKAIL
jgi:hypothetical protein